MLANLHAPEFERFSAFESARKRRNFGAYCSAGRLICMDLLDEVGLLHLLENFDAKYLTIFVCPSWLKQVQAVPKLQKAVIHSMIEGRFCMGAAPPQVKILPYAKCHELFSRQAIVGPASWPTKMTAPVGKVCRLAVNPD